MIPDEVVERVREAADIVAIVGEHVRLKRSGGDWRGPCPFHHGRNPNFSVSPKRGSYHCFKCGAAGDVITFVREQLGLDFVEAVKYVGERSGIVVEEVRTRRDGERDPREPIWEVNAAARDFFQRTLWESEAAEPARDYLVSRSIDRETADRFQLGYAPRGRALEDHLATLGYSEERLLEAGLLARREEGADAYARFRDRLIIPILDVRERCVGFGGRIMTEDARAAKYLNSPETAAFSKGQLLYNLHVARNAIRKLDQALVVEGYFDVIRVASAGVEQVVAGLGTALTADQAALIVRLSRNVFLLYDSDEAGQKATFRAALELLRLGASVRVVTLPEGEDPDSFVRAHGAAGLEAQMQRALDVFERQVQILERRGWFADLHRRRRAIDRLLPTIRAASDPLTRDLYLARASEVSGVARDVLAREAQAQVPRVVPPRETRVPHERGGDRRVGDRRRDEAPTSARARVADSAERNLVRAMLARPALIERAAERESLGHLQNPIYKEIFDALMATAGEVDLAALPATLESALGEAAVPVMQAMLEENAGGFEIERTFNDSVRDLIERELIERSDELRRAIRVATSDEEKNRLIQELDRLGEQRAEAGGRRWRVGHQR